MTQENKSVIIVDDDEDDRSFLRDAFLENGFPDNFRMFDNGVKLMDYLRAMSEVPLLIIIDLHMPIKGGREIINEIKSDPLFRTIPIITFSTSLTNQIRKDMLKLGANCVISKPNSYDEILVVTKSIGLVFNL